MSGLEYLGLGHRIASFYEQRYVVCFSDVALQPADNAPTSSIEWWLLFPSYEQTESMWQRLRWKDSETVPNIINKLHFSRVKESFVKIICDLLVGINIFHRSVRFHIDSLKKPIQVYTQCVLET